MKIKSFLGIITKFFTGLISSFKQKLNKNPLAICLAGRQAKYKILNTRFYIALGLIILLAPLAYFTFRHPKTTEAAWMDDNWGYRKAIAIPSHTSAENNVYVTVPTFDATDTTKFQSDCGDLRFTSQNGELLAYYVVDCDATANIHVLFDTLAAGASTYYMYYGNPSAPNGFSSADFPNAASGLGTQTLAAEEKSPGPVAYWKFDEGVGSTAYDSTQNGNNGSLGAGSSAPAWQTEDMCISGKCLKFDGTNDYVSTSNTNNAIANKTTYTIETWFRTGSASAADGRMYAEGSTSTDTPIVFLGYGFLSTEVRFYARDNSNASVSLASTVTGLNDNKWHHAVGVRNGSNFTVYIDGISAGSTTATIGTTTINKISLGAHQRASVAAFFNGFLDDVKIYPYARTAAQIKADYAGRGTTKGSAAILSASKDQGDFLSKGLVSYWKMDEASWSGAAGEVIDSSGNANHGVGVGATAPPTTGAGKFGNGGSFDGSDYVDIANESNFDITSSLTLSSWFKSSAATSGLIISKNANGSTTNGYRLFMNQLGQISIDIYNSGAKTALATTAYNDGQWHLATGVFDGQRVVIYVDGVAKTTTSGGSIANNNYAVKIGYVASGSGNYFTGTIDDVRIYNRALSPVEVQDLYNWAPGPVAYYNFDEKTGINANDISGNSNTATLGTGSSAPSWTTGKYGGALNFDGSNDYVSLTSTPIQTTNFTVSAWAKTVGTGGGSSADNFIFLQRDDATGDNKSAITLAADDGSNAIFSARSSSGTNQSLTATKKPEDEWHYYAGTVTNSTISFYIDGQLVDWEANNQSGNYTTSIDYIDIGKNKYSGEDKAFFNGLIDDVKIYNYARSQKQIVEDMLGGRSLGGGRNASSAIAYYPFDEGYGSTANNSGNGGSTLNGTLGTGNSAPSWSNDGKSGKALSFNGINSAVYKSDDNALDMRTGGFSAFAWIKTPSATGAHDVIIDKGGTSAGAVGYWFSIETNGLLQLLISDGSSYIVQTNSNTSIGDNMWHNVGFVWDPTSGAKFYIDSKLDKTVPATTSVDLNSGALFFIGGYSSSGFTINGLIDEVKIYNYALTEDEINLDYNQGKALVLGALSSGTGNTAPENAASQEYCVPGDTASCTAPVAEWSFNEGVGSSAFDTSGNGKVGSWIGTLNNQWTTGKIGKSGNYNGTNNYVQIAQGHNFLSNNITISMWVYPTSWTHQTHTALVTSRSTSSNGLMFFILSQGNLNFDWGDGASSYRWDTGYQPPLNTWTHLTISRDVNGRYLYANGKLQNSTGTAGGNPTANTTFIIGADSSSEEYFYKGKIDQVRIYNYARTPAQIAWDYNRGEPVGWWKFDECQGAMAYDSSGIGNTGSISIGATGTQGSLGTCTAGVGSTAAWGNGSVGKYNSSLNFDGTDDYVDMGDPANDILDFGLGQSFSISSWVRRSALSSRHLIVAKLSSWAAGSAGYYLFIENDNKVHGRVGDSTQSLVYTTNTIDTNWHHIVFTYNPLSTTGLNIYIDGIQATYDLQNDPTSRGSIANSGNFYIGQQTNGLNKFSGQLDDVRIYNYALTPLQIRQLYNENSAVRFGPSTGSP